MAFADTGRNIDGVTNSVTSINITLNNTVAGNLVVVVSGSTRGGGPEPTLIVTDGGNTWTNEGVSYTGDTDGEAASISWSVLTTGGNRTINVSGNGVNSYAFYAAAREFTGPHASPSSGSAVGNTGTGATMDTTAVTPADNDALVVAVGASVSSGAITENQSPGDTGWTLSDEDEGTGGTPASFVFKILSGAPGTPRAAWSHTSSAWAARIKAFKPAAAGGRASKNIRSFPLGSMLGIGTGIGGGS